MIRFDLRHTAATLMLTAGVNPKVVSQMVGHSSVAITLDRYSHVIPTMQAEAALRMDQLLSYPERVQQGCGGFRGQQEAPIHAQIGTEG